MTDLPTRHGRPGDKSSWVGVRLLLAGCLLLAVVSALAVFSRYGHYFDLISHFRVQYIIALVPMTAMCWWLRSKKIAFVLAVVLSLHAVEVIRSQNPSDAGLIRTAHSGQNAIAGQTIRLLSINLLAVNTEADPAIAHINAVDPDVLLVVEYSPWWAKRLRKRLPQYPHFFGRTQPGVYGVAVFSKFALTKQQIRLFARKNRPSVQVQIESSLGPVTLIGTHPPPPRSAQLYALRNRQLRAIAKHVRQISGPVIVAGDLNITPWSAHFKEFASGSRLRDSRRGFGLLPTWPVGLAIARIPIDHILVSNGIRVQSRQAGGDIGSDHWSVWADLSWPTVN